MAKRMAHHEEVVEVHHVLGMASLEEDTILRVLGEEEVLRIVPAEEEAVVDHGRAHHVGDAKIPERSN